MRALSPYGSGMTITDVAGISTDAAMLALWRRSAFVDVESYVDWEARVNDPLTELIRSGALVPIGIQQDGAFAVQIIVSPDAPSSRHQQYQFMRSEPYLLDSDGSPVHLSALEGVGDVGRSALTIDLPLGRWAVRVWMLDWDQEPGAVGNDGLPTPGALPDFLVVVASAADYDEFRTREETFDPPTV